MIPPADSLAPAPRPRLQSNAQRAVLWARATLCVVVMALVGVIALPDRHGPSPALQRARQGRAALQALGDFRSAIAAYRIDQGVWPGWEPVGGSGDDLGTVAACAEVLVAQLARNPAAEPYLPAGVPPNPLNGLASVRVLGPGEPWPLTADDRTGWLYDPRSGLVKLNSQGRLEGTDVRYFDR